MPSPLLQIVPSVSMAVSCFSLDESSFPKLDLGVTADYCPTSNEIDNFIFLCFKHVTGEPHTDEDRIKCIKLAGDRIRGEIGLSRYLEHISDSIWDSCEEEDYETVSHVYRELKPHIEAWYADASRDERNMI